MNLAEVEEQAQAARERLGIGNDSPIPDIVRLIEDQGGVHVGCIPFPAGGPDGVYAVQREEAFIIINSAVDPVRQRFTVAHEFGHHVFGDGIVWDQHVTWAAKDPKEVRANRFASAFLMPRAAIDHWFRAHGDPEVDLDTLVRVANFFGVSAKAARIRLEKTKKIRRPTLVKALDDEIDAGAHLTLQRRLGLTAFQDTLASSHHGFRVPARMTASYLEALSQGRIDAVRVADRLHADVRVVEKAIDSDLTAKEEGLPVLSG